MTEYPYFIFATVDRSYRRQCDLLDPRIHVMPIAPMYPRHPLTDKPLPGHPDYQELETRIKREICSDKVVAEMFARSRRQAI